jgi:hypothetical protein
VARPTRFELLTSAIGEDPDKVRNGHALAVARFTDNIVRFGLNYKFDQVEVLKAKF